MEGNVEFRGEVAAELQIAVGFGAAKAVMKVSRMKDDSQFAAAFLERAEERYRIRPARKADGYALAWLQQRCVENDAGRG